MKCSEFDRRLQQQLDQRLQPEADSALRRHASACDDCRGKLGAWQRIALVLPTGSEIARDVALQVGVGSPRSGFRVWMPAAATLAAAVMLAFVVPRDDSDSRVDVTPGEPGAVVVQASADVDPSLWWHTVQDRDWVEQTMPAVRSVRDGVAPLGRSLLQAVTILTSGGGERLTGGGGERPS